MKGFLKKMTISALIAATVTIQAAASIGSAAENADTPRAVAVEVDSAKLDATAYLVDGRTMVPLRAIFERLNATIEWNGEERSVTATKGTTIIKLWVDRTEATAGGRNVTLDVPPMLINSSTYVPLRFVSEALGSQVTFDAERETAVVKTGSGCAVSGGQVHQGAIKPGGETWGVCGSPHFVKGDFIVAGKDSPVLTIEAGAVVRFENGASISVGTTAPGGFVIEGKENNPATLTADTAGAQPGFWQGVRYYEQTVKGKAYMEHARIEYAGGPFGAVAVESEAQAIELKLLDVEIKNSLYTGLYLQGNSRLAKDSGKVRIIGTKSSEDGGGTPIITGISGTHNLPDGEYKGNESDAILIESTNSIETITSNTIWRNIGIPYQAARSLTVDGPAAPVLTIEPGVVIMWNADTGLYVGGRERGGLVAVGSKDKPVQFTSDLGRAGAWEGIHFGNSAVGKNVKLQHTVIEYAKRGVYFSADLGPAIKDSAIRNNKEYGVVTYGEKGTNFLSGLGNTFVNNGADQGNE
ncbi:copper amine oxidase N-terminal domain-containing protein [Paenibacillus mesophilus]|uniref:copper amine oxidase N-terminal domain-containing protein n=1 Tax=Paenibacillus mesophilus TaxID=2582849 RepID=UPI00110D9CEC|nr:copper amine oxidase N-terminal domain-containing protein [Paenibacillus mesophilus]TMV47301.1 copper amine oxidase N-terminal domain-containing protein [Paenibacillus mesophilus]